VQPAAARAACATPTGICCRAAVNGWELYDGDELYAGHLDVDDIIGTRSSARTSAYRVRSAPLMRSGLAAVPSTPVILIARFDLA